MSLHKLHLTTAWWIFRSSPRLCRYTHVCLHIQEIPWRVEVKLLLLLLLLCVATTMRTNECINEEKEMKKVKKKDEPCAWNTSSSSSQQTTVNQRWFRATETSAKKWVIRYKAISTRVVFLLLSCASYTTDVRKYCVEITDLVVYLSNYIEREHWTRAGLSIKPYGKSLATHDWLSILF